jgi:ketosteroid isomerase-like protein
MRKLILVMAMLMTASFLTACDPATNTNSANKPANTANTATVKTAAEIATIETDIKKLVSDAAATMSKNDVAAFEKMTTDNYMFINPDGKMSTKAERTAALRSGETKYESVAYDDVLVRVNPYGTGAIVTGRATVKGVNMGNKVDGQFRITQVWRKTDDGWKNAHGHATAIAAAASAPASNTAAANKPATSPPAAKSPPAANATNATNATNANR